MLSLCRVVDTRYNGGGWLHNDIALLLGGREYVRFSPRGQYIGSVAVNIQRRDLRNAEYDRRIDLTLPPHGGHGAWHQARQNPLR